MTWTMGSLFDGIGGFVLAGQWAGFQTLWSSEVDRHALAVTRLRFPEVQHLGDICEIHGGKIPPVHLITFGSPCQDLSVAGNRAGLSGERSSLYGEAVRVIREMREATDGLYPEFIIWENVPGAFSSNAGRDFGEVLRSLAECGAMDIGWRVLDALHSGVPQRRKRIVLVADFRGKRTGQILFESKRVPWHPAEGDEARKIVATRVGDGAEVPGGGVRVYDMTHADEVIRPVPSGAPTLQRRMGTGGNQVPILLLAPVQALKTRIRHDDNSAQANHLIPVGGWRVRKLTPRECERLMGEPDDWTLDGLSGSGEPIQLTDNARYRLIGNSIVIHVFAEVMTYIADELEGAHGLAGGA